MNIEALREQVRMYLESKDRLTDIQITNRSGVSASVFREFACGRVETKPRSIMLIENFIKEQGIDMAKRRKFEITLPTLVEYINQAKEQGHFPFLDLNDVPGGACWNECSGEYIIPSFVLRESYFNWCKSKGYETSKDTIGFAISFTKNLAAIVPGLAFSSIFAKIRGGRFHAYSFPSLDTVRPAEYVDICSRLALKSSESGPLTSTELDILLEFFSRVTTR